MFIFEFMHKIHSFFVILTLFLGINSYSQGELIQKIDENKIVFDSLIRNSDYEKIPPILQESINLSKQINNDSITANVYAMNAQFYHFTSNFEETTKYLIKSVSLYEKTGNISRAIKMSNNLSVVLERNKHYDESLKIRKKVLKIAQKEKEHRMIATMFVNIGISYRNPVVKNLDSSFYYTIKALNYSKKHDYKDLIGSSYTNLQQYYQDKKLHKTSLKYADTIERFYKNDLNRGLYENSVSISANTLFDLKRYEESLVKCKHAIELYEKINLTETLNEVYATMSAIYQKQGNYKKALQAKEWEVNIKDSILGVERQNTIIELEQKFENEKKEKENLQLKQESAVKDLTISNKNNTILWSFLGFITILSLFASYQLRKTKKANKSLEKAIHSKEVLEKELTTVRTNIAQDFHDDLGNKLARISIFSQLLSKKLNPKKEKEKSMLSHIVSDTNYLYKGTRDFIFSLKSESDYAEELATYLSDFGEEYFKEFNIDFEIEKHIDANEKLPYYWSKQLIYIFKEAMTNVAKHANASKVNLLFDYRDKELNISCTDDGKGFDTAQLKSDNGLHHMKERAEKIKGNFEIVSNKDKTIIRFTGKTTI